MGLNYKQIHTILIKEGFDIGTSPSCVFSMIKKLKKRERILNVSLTTDPFWEN